MIGFHRILISAFIIFCVTYTVWAGWMFVDTRQFWAGSSAVSFGLLTLAFGYYLKNLERFLHR